MLILDLALPVDELYLSGLKKFFDILIYTVGLLLSAGVFDLHVVQALSGEVTTWVV